MKIIEINVKQLSRKDLALETNSNAFERLNFSLSNTKSLSILIGVHLTTGRSVVNRNAKPDVHCMLREWFNAQQKFHRIRELTEACLNSYSWLAELFSQQSPAMAVTIVQVQYIYNCVHTA